VWKNRRTGRSSSSSTSVSIAVGNQLFGALPPPSGLECGSMGQTHTLQPGLTTLFKLTQLSLKKKTKNKNEFDQSLFALFSCKFRVIPFSPSLRL